MTTSVPVPVNLAEQARVIVKLLRENGFPPEMAVNRSVLNLAEEVGEFVGAYRRWTGQARRSGTAPEMWDELADVVIAAYVLAAELDIDLDTVIRAKLDVVFTRGWREPPPFRCPEPRICPCNNDPDDHQAVQRHRGHDGTGLNDCWYCEWPGATEPVSTADDAPHTVPCGWSCGYLAASETDLNTHETGCDLEPAGGDV